MNKRIYQTSQFKKDVKRLQKQGKDFVIFKKIIECLASGLALDVCGGRNDVDACENRFSC